MAKISEPPTPPTYEYLSKLSADELLEVDTSTLHSQPRLFAYLLGRLEQDIIAQKQRHELDLEWSDHFDWALAKKDTEVALKQGVQAELRAEKLDKQRIIKYNEMKEKAMSFKSNDRTLGELYTKYSFDEKGNMTSYKNDREIIALHENKKYEPLNKFKYDEDDMMKWTEWCFDIVDRYNRQDAKGQINGLKMNQINTLATWLKYRDKEKTCKELDIKMGSLNTNLRRIRIKLKDTPFVNHVKI